MTQLYDISYSDYESGNRWILEGPELTPEQWENLWDEVRIRAIEIEGNKLDTVFEDMLLYRIIPILVSEKGFKELQAPHHKRFNFAGSYGNTELYKGVPDKWIPEVYNRLNGKSKNI